jgi:zinc protease
VIYERKLGRNFRALVEIKIADMKKNILVTLAFLPFAASAFDYPSFSTTLKNGLKVVVCEKPGNDFVETEVWYRTGSKDEKPGIRGMAHMFEHMMFRGTKKFPGDAVFDNVKAVGGTCNAYTSFDRTVYHEYVPVTALELMMDLESDRMQNLVVTQEILNTEREVVGQELRNGLSNWYQKMSSDRYPLLYPAGHPYEVDVIGNLEEITKFNSEQCMEFYNNYYSPNNAFLVIVGNVKHEDVFKLAEKYYGPITKQLDIRKRSDVPDVFNARVKSTDMPLNFPVQIYGYVYPRVAASHPDFFALNMFTQMMFLDPNSVLNNRLVKKEQSAYGINAGNDDWSLYPNIGVIDIIMGASPGNVKVKKAIREEIGKVAADGVSQDAIDKFVQSLSAQDVFGSYDAANVAANLGLAEYHFGDYNVAYKLTDMYKKVKPEDLKRIASTYFTDEKIQVINIKPEY